MPSIYNQTIDKHKGDSYVLQFNIEDVVSLDGYTASWIMAVDRDAETAIISKSTANAGEMYFVANSVFVVIEIEDTDIASGIEPDVYYHELRLTDGDGEGGIVSAGAFNLRKPQQEV